MTNGTCCGYPVHEAAALFPLLPEAELKELAEDIKAKGLIYPVILCDKAVLDGRNRLLACERAGVEPYFKNYEAKNSKHSPTEYVLALNSKRRQLTIGQKAAIAAGSLPMLEAEAKERRKATEGRPSKLEAKLPQDKGREPQSRDKAAKLMGVSPRYVSDAKKIKAKSSEVFQQVANGEKTLSAAKKELGWGEFRKQNMATGVVGQIQKLWEKCTPKDKDFLREWVQHN